MQQGACAVTPAQPQTLPGLLCVCGQAGSDELCRTLAAAAHIAASSPERGTKFFLNVARELLLGLVAEDVQIFADVRMTDRDLAEHMLRQLHAELGDQLLLAEVVSTGWALLAELLRGAAPA